MCEEKWTHTFFCYGASDGGTFHFSLGVDNYASIVLIKMSSEYKLGCNAMTYLKVKEDTIPSTPCFALTDNDDRHS